MKRENEEFLYANFPLLYRLRNDPSVPVSFGFACGDGWFEIVKDVSEKLETVVSGMNEPLEKRPAAFDVAEHNGHLRFDLRSGRGLHDLAQEALLRSLQTCELCGSPGEIRRDCRWLRTLCARCHERARERLGWLCEVVEPPAWMDREDAARLSYVLKNMGEKLMRRSRHSVYDREKRRTQSHPLCGIRSDLIAEALDFTETDEDAYRRILQSHYIVLPREVGREAALELIAHARRALSAGRSVERLLRRAVEACRRGDVEETERALDEAHRLETEATGEHEFTSCVASYLRAVRDEDGWRVPKKKELRLTICDVRGGRTATVTDLASGRDVAREDLEARAVEDLTRLLRRTREEGWTSKLVLEIGPAETFDDEDS